MTFFTGLGIFIVSLLGYLLLFGIGILFMGAESTDSAYFGALFVGIIISVVLTAFICQPEQFGYQKITVSENVMEVQE